MIEYVAIVIMFCIAGGIAFVIIGMPRPLTRAKDIGRLNKEFRRRTKVMGNRDWGDCLLSNPGLYIFDNGIALEDKPFRKSSQEPAFLQRISLWLFLQKIFTKKLDISIVQRHNLSYN